ncbi:MAG: UbiD family decarboxylase [Pirellulales bacterium]|nr:UbiD family decarboxylase [Pirellulales bacterium]
MSYSSLADFVEELERDGLLLRIRAEVDADLEIAEITQRIARERGPALLFERVAGQRLPVLTNLLAGSERLIQALGVESVAEIGARLRQSAAEGEATAAGGRVGWWRRTFGSSNGAGAAGDPFEPKLVKTGHCQQVVRLATDVNLAELPALRAWPGESCRSIRTGRLHTVSPETERRTTEEIAVGLLDARRLTLLWGPHDAARAHYQEHQARGTKMSLAITLGGDPLGSLVVSAPWASEIDLYRWMGAWRGRPVEMVRCRSHELRVPADVELVLEGIVDPAAELVPGPTLATPSGYLHTYDAAPVMHVTAITHRANPLFPALVLGSPPHELTQRAEVTEQLLLPYLQYVAAEIADVALLEHSPSGHVAVVAICKSYPGQTRKVAAALWGLAPAFAAKVVILVDADIDPHQAALVWQRVAANTHPERDFFFAEGPTGVMDHAATRLTLGSSVAIDATAKLAGEHPRAWPSRAASCEDTAERVARRWQEYGLERALAARY